MRIFFLDFSVCTYGTDVCQRFVFESATFHYLISASSEGNIISFACL